MNWKGENNWCNFQHLLPFLLYVKFSTKATKLWYCRNQRWYRDQLIELIGRSEKKTTKTLTCDNFGPEGRTGVNQLTFCSDGTCDIQKLGLKFQTMNFFQISLSRSHKSKWGQGFWWCRTTRQTQCYHSRLQLQFLS